MDADLLTTLARLISPILSNPDAMRSLSSLFGASEETMAAKEITEGETSEEAPQAPGTDKAKRREELLRALRPYLSGKKSDRIEGLIRASAMLEMLEGAKKI